jgi:hypothetical protein
MTGQSSCCLQSSQSMTQHHLKLHALAVLRRQWSAPAQPSHPTPAAPGPAGSGEDAHGGVRDGGGAGVAAGAAGSAQCCLNPKAHMEDVQFAVGDYVLLDTEHTAFPRWMIVVHSPACTLPTIYLDIPAALLVFSEFNHEQLRPYLCRPYKLGGDASPPPPPYTPRGWWAGARCAGAATDEDALRPAPERPLSACGMGCQRRVGKHVGLLDNLTNSAEAITAFEPLLSPAAASAAGRRHRCAAAAHPSCRFQLSTWTMRRPETWGRCWWGVRCSTGGLTTAGSALAAPWRVPDRRAPSCTW